MWIVFFLNVWFEYTSRFCPEKYHPFDHNNINKYVIGDDYLPTWKVPSLKKYYIDQGASMKMSVESHLKTLGNYQVDEIILCPR